MNYKKLNYLLESIIRKLSNEEVDEQAAPAIKVVHPGILELPEDGFVNWGVSKLVGHMVSLAKEKGKGAIMKALLNLERWNKSKNPELSAKARSVIDKLMASAKWTEM
jgi:hypothetical protein